MPPQNQGNYGNQIPPVQQPQQVQPVKNGSSKLNTVLLIVIIILLGVGLFMFYQKKEVNDYGITQNNDPLPTTNQYTQTNEPISIINDQASWYIPNQSGWVDHTLTWKKYTIGTTTFSYPSTYIVKTNKVESRPDVYYDEITIIDPNNRSGMQDTIYVGVPYTGANNLVSVFEIKENVNNSGTDFAISLQASNFAKHIFNNIVASVNK